MKNAMHIPSFRKSILISMMFVCLTPFLMAQVEFNETIKFEADINPDGTLNYTNRSFDTEIKTWDNNAVMLQMEVILKGKHQEDVDKTLKAIKGIKFKGHSSLVTVNTTFWESVVCNSNRHKMKLHTGEKVTLTKYSIHCTLFVPKTISLDINSKYADVNVEDVAGRAKFKIYNGKLYGGSIGQQAVLDLRYSKAFMENVPEADITLYDSDIVFKSCGSLKVESKYSKIEIEQVGDTHFKSYDDDFTIGKLGKVEGEAKYSDFDFGPSVNLFFNFYDSNLKAGPTGAVKGTGSKYSEIEVSKATSVDLDSSYDDTFVLGKIESFTCYQSKYTDFTIEHLAKEFTLNSYDDNVIVRSMAADFSKIDIDGKYGDYRLTVPNSASYKLLVNMKYGKVDYPESAFDRKIYIRENSQLEVEATTKNYSGDVQRFIQLKGYDSKLIIQD